MGCLVFVLATGKAMMERQFIFSYERYFLPKASFKEPTPVSYTHLTLPTSVTV